MLEKEKQNSRCQIYEKKVGISNLGNIWNLENMVEKRHEISLWELHHAPSPAHFTNSNLVFKQYPESRLLKQWQMLANINTLPGGRCKQLGSSWKEPLPAGQALPSSSSSWRNPVPSTEDSPFPSLFVTAVCGKQREDWQPLQNMTNTRQEEWDAYSPQALGSHAPSHGFLTNPQTSSSGVGLPWAEPPLHSGCRFSQNMHEAGVTK